MNSGRVEVAFASSDPTAFLAEGACISWYQVTVCEPVAAGRRTGAERAQGSGCRSTCQLSPISRSTRELATSRVRSGSGASICFAKAR